MDSRKSVSRSAPLSTTAFKLMAPGGAHGPAAVVARRGGGRHGAPGSAGVWCRWIIVVGPTRVQPALEPLAGRLLDASRSRPQPNDA